MKALPTQLAAFDPPTLQFYSEEAPTYPASGPSGASRHLPTFLELLRPGSHILELGCGGGVDAEAMIGRGFVVDPTDGTPEIAQKAQERLGQPVRIMRFEEMDAIEACDAVWAHASLVHVPRAGLPGALKQVFRALHPGGFHFANFRAGELKDAIGSDAISII